MQRMPTTPAPVTAFGTWPSALGPEVMATGSRRIAAPTPMVDRDGRLGWVWAESRPDEGGRTTLVHRDATGTTTALLDAPWDVGTRVHTYGGRAHAVTPDGVAFVHRPDGSLWLRTHAGDVRPLVGAQVCGLAEPVHDAARSRLIAVAEWARDGGFPRASLVEIALPSGRVRELCAGADFYAAPTIAPDGERLAWVQWDHPHMPWDAGAVYTARLDAAGDLVGARHVAGDARASAQQPTWSDAGELYFLWEPDGAWTLWRERAGRTERVFASADELGGPMWNLGMRTWGFVARDTALAVRVHEGVAQVIRIDVESGASAAIVDDAPSVGHLAVAAGQAAIVEGWDGRGTALRLVDAAGVEHARRETGLFDALAPSDWSVPEPVRFATSAGDAAFGWFYPPKLGDHRGPDGAAPPLVVVAHGGPTGLALASGNLPVQFWTSRGYAVLDVNYRGSTGFGRAYRERLRGMWGVFDVEDCVAGARHLAAQGRVDPERMVIRGGSAGGFTALAAVAFHDGVFRAAASYYGVSDVASLVADTHKFESHYDRFLFGEHADPTPVWRERSPLYAADRIAVPVIFFQGLDDPAVPPSQTEQMVAALRGRGVEVEYRAYPGEGHGFRRAETIIDAWTREAAFYRRVLALDPA